MRSFAQWSAPLPGGGTSPEAAIAFDQSREKRLLILPALFDEANKLRRLTVETMRRLDLSGIDCFLPDWPGQNDSLQPLESQTLDGWRACARTAATHFRATHVLTMRSGALLVSEDLPGWRYAPQGGKQLVRSMLRARTISARERGVQENTAELDALGRKDGITLAGWKLGPKMFSALADAPKPPTSWLVDIAQEDVGGSGLWLRAEPGEDHEQADAIAAIVAVGMSTE